MGGIFKHESDDPYSNPQQMNMFPAILPALVALQNRGVQYGITHQQPHSSGHGGMQFGGQVISNNPFLNPYFTPEPHNMYSAPTFQSYMGYQGLQTPKEKFNQQVDNQILRQYPDQPTQPVQQDPTTGLQNYGHVAERVMNPQDMQIHDYIIESTPHHYTNLGALGLNTGQVAEYKGNVYGAKR